jgi:hypothetical protein
VPRIALAAIPSWRLGDVAIFGGVTGRNHPTIEKHAVTDRPDDGEGPRMGSLSLMASLGFEAELAAGLRLGMALYQPFPVGPVSYAPTVSAHLAIPLFRRPPGSP